MEITSKKPAFQHFKQLDGLRAFAVGFVLIEHFVPFQYNGFKEIFKFGYTGVLLFFVLSGFLIGGILLKNREQYETLDWSKVGTILKKFYMRRTLRIFPIYYLLITVLLLIGYPDSISKIALWCYTYTFNIWIFISGGTFFPLGSIWTLCQEEQFYMMLPFMILLTPKRFQFPIIMGMILLGMVFRVSIYLKGGNDIAYTRLVFSSFDSFGLGVLLAWLLKNNKLTKVKLWWSCIPFILFLYFGNSIANFPGKSFLYIFIPTFSIGSAVLIGAAVTGGMSWLGKLCEMRPIMYFGKISYGVYLYNGFCLIAIEHFLPKLGIEALLSWQAIAVLAFMLTLAVASLSYHFIELPINKLKSKFDY